MHLKRRSLPVILLLSVIPILFLFFIHPSLRLSFPTPTPINPNPNFSFSVKVLAFDRLPSLRRCLRSLAAADYAGDRVALHVYVDHFREASPADASDVVDRRLGEARRILEFLDAFAWGHGEKRVHYRVGNVGLQGQWIEAWWPASDDDFVFVVEDDLEVSPLYYRYLKALILKYYYDPENYSASIYGASLQRPRFVPGKHGNKLQLNAETHLFLYQLVGTWGQLLFPKPWKEFRLWYDMHKSKGIKPLLEGMVTTGWYKRMGEKIWTPWFIKFIHSRGYYNIYTNFQHERALSVSHRDAGVNYGKSAGPDSTLLDEKSLDFNIWQLQPLTNLKWYDFCFKEVLPKRIVRRSGELISLLDSMQTQKSVILVSVFGTAERVARNLICHFERLNVKNHIFIGSNSGLLFDLARRGHPVVYSDDLDNDIRVHESRTIKHTNTGIEREVLVRAYIVKKCLEQGKDSWVINSNLLPISDSMFQQADASYDISVTTKIADILYVRGSSNIKRAWTNDFINNLVLTARSSASVAPNSYNRLLFANMVADELDKSRGIRIVAESAVLSGAELGSTNTTSMVGIKKFVFWDSETELLSLEKRLTDAEMWIIDGDSSCTAVVCHQS